MRSHVVKTMGAQSEGHSIFKYSHPSIFTYSIKIHGTASYRESQLRKRIHMFGRVLIFPQTLQRPYQCLTGSSTSEGRPGSSPGAGARLGMKKSRVPGLPPGGSRILSVSEGGHLPLCDKTRQYSLLSSLHPVGFLFHLFAY